MAAASLPAFDPVDRESAGEDVAARDPAATKRALEALLRDAPPAARRAAAARRGPAAAAARRPGSRRWTRSWAAASRAGSSREIHGPASSGRTGLVLSLLAARDAQRVPSPRSSTRSTASTRPRPPPRGPTSRGSSGCAGRGATARSRRRGHSPTPRRPWRRSPARGCSTSWPSTSPARGSRSAPLPSTTWLRLQRLVEETPTALVLVADGHVACGPGGASLALEPAGPRWSGPPGPGRLLAGRSTPSVSAGRHGAALGRPHAAGPRLKRRTRRVRRAALSPSSPGDGRARRRRAGVHAAGRGPRRRRRCCSTCTGLGRRGRAPDDARAARCSTRPPPRARRGPGGPRLLARDARSSSPARGPGSPSCPPAARRAALAPLPLALLDLDARARGRSSAAGACARSATSRGCRRWASPSASAPRARASCGSRAARTRASSSARAARRALRDDARAGLAGGRPRAARLPPRAACSSRCAPALAARGRKAAALALELGLVDGATHARRLAPAAPSGEARTWRTLVLLDLEAHPPRDAIARITARAEPTARARGAVLAARPRAALAGAARGDDGAARRVDGRRPRRRAAARRHAPARGLRVGDVRAGADRAARRPRTRRRRRAWRCAPSARRASRTWC